MKIYNNEKRKKEEKKTKYKFNILQNKNHLFSLAKPLLLIYCEYKMAIFMYTINNIIWFLKLLTLSLCPISSVSFYTFLLYTHTLILCISDGKYNQI